MWTHRSQAAIEDAVQIDASQSLRAGALRQQLEGGLQLRLLLLRVLRVLAVPHRGVCAAGAPEPRLPPVQRAVLLLLVLKIRRVDVRVVLHGCELLGVDTRELRRMLWASAAVVWEVRAVLCGSTRLLLLHLLLAVKGVASQARSGASAAGERPATLRIGCRRARCQRGSGGRAEGGHGMQFVLPRTRQPLLR